MADGDPKARARWLHISDFHIKEASSYDRDRVLGALIRSLPSLVGRTGAFDFIVASGDIAFSGKKAEYDRATSFFDELLSKSEVGKDRLFVVPGNHDVDRTRNNALARTLDSPQAADQYFGVGTELPHVNLKQASYLAWYDTYFAGIRTFPRTSTFAELITFSVRGLEFTISLINSAAFSADDYDSGKLLIGRRCAEVAANECEKNQSSLKIAVMHHPLSWISMVESANVKGSLRQTFDIVLSGHLHETDLEQAQGINGAALHLTAGAAYQGSKWPNTAMICEYDGRSVKVLPIQFVDRPRDAWTVDPSIFPDAFDFSQTYLLPRNSLAQGAEPPTVEGGEDGDEDSAADWQDDLFTTGSGAKIYIEPRLMPYSQETAVSHDEQSDPISVDSIIASSESFIIEARAGYGNTNLGRRLHALLSRRENAEFRDARNFPNYKAKILPDLSSFKGSSAPTTLILDNFDADEHQRMLKEVFSTGLVKRVILMSVSREVGGGLLVDPDTMPYIPKRVYLWPFSREGLRRATEIVFDSGDATFVSRTVDKVYSDLLSLCIPLTAPNVIMYLRVLAKESDFTPLNRVHIHNRYISEGLSKSSDVYRGNFNAKNKIDVIAAFTHSIYEVGATDFSGQDWFRFCDFHKTERLKEFDEADLLSELVTSGLCLKRGGRFYFRYHFFFHFFLGRHLATHRDALDAFLDKEKYLQLSEVIDVVTGLESANDVILSHLTDQLIRRLDEFGRKYVKPSFDPLLPAVWPDRADEQDKLWKPVYAAIESGPASTDEVDKLKTSILAEARTHDQQVTYHQFTEMEHALFIIGTALSDALRNSDDALASLKLNALQAILRTELVAFQVGVMFADRLASQRHFIWGGVLFTDFNKMAIDADPNTAEAIVPVITSLSEAVAIKISDEIGTHKLSHVFRAAAKKVTSIGFLEVLLFACILEAKGPKWTETLRELTLKTGKNAFYLRLQLALLMRSIHTGIERGKDIESTKRLVALIHSKRGHNKHAPGEKMVSRMLNHLENKNEFGSSTNEATN